MSRSAASARSPPHLAQADRACSSGPTSTADQAWLQAQSPPQPPTAALPPDQQALTLAATMVVAVVGAAWVVSDKIGKVGADLRHFEGATTATLQHHSAQLAHHSAQLQQQNVQLAQQSAQLQHHIAQLQHHSAQLAQQSAQLAQLVELAQENK
ncbi:hypothetical protein ABPG75_013373 [Micractinium tetrahymenae]